MEAAREVQPARLEECVGICVDQVGEAHGVGPILGPATRVARGAADAEDAAAGQQRSSVVESWDHTEVAKRFGLDIVNLNVEPRPCHVAAHHGDIAVVENEHRASIAEPLGLRSVDPLEGCAEKRALAIPYIHVDTRIAVERDVIWVTRIIAVR